MARVLRQKPLPSLIWILIPALFAYVLFLFSSGLIRKMGNRLSRDCMPSPFTIWLENIVMPMQMGLAWDVPFQRSKSYTLLDEFCVCTCRAGPQLLMRSLEWSRSWMMGLVDEFLVFFDHRATFWGRRSPNIGWRDSMNYGLNSCIRWCCEFTMLFLMEVLRPWD